MNTRFKKILGVVATVTFLFVFSRVAFADSNASLWKLVSGRLVPIKSTWNLKIPALGGSGTTCLQSDNTGVISVTGSGCGGSGGSTVKVSSADTTAGYLADKLINGDNTIKLNIEDGGLNERLSAIVDTTVDMNWQADQTFASTGGILLPMGNTSERPSLTGYFRFNTESDSLEYLNAEMAWQELATTTLLGGYIPKTGLSSGVDLNSQTFSNLGALTLTPASLTGSSATKAFDLQQTWNTSGNPIAIFANITNTASGASALIADWQVGGVSQFNVSKTGGLTSRSSIVATAGGVQIASGNSFTFASRSRINSLTNGNILLWNQAQTDFGLLQLGGTTSSFPALKRSGTGLISRLADDTANAPFTASNLISTGVVRLKGYTVATLPAGTQGDTAFVTDALAPTFLGAIVGGGAVVSPVFYNGTAWVAQ